MQNVPDHPVIRNLERTGYPDGQQERDPICPMCGEVCDTIYIRYGCPTEILGCEGCVQECSAGEFEACFPDYSEEDF